MQGFIEQSGNARDKMIDIRKHPRVAMRQADFDFIDYLLSIDRPITVAENVRICNLYIRKQAETTQNDKDRPARGVSEKSTPVNRVGGTGAIIPPEKMKLIDNPFGRKT